MTSATTDLAHAPFPAPPATVYSIPADYHRGHAAILPAKYFVGLDVEEGERRKIMYALKLTRLVNAPLISAGVMIANII